MAQVFSDRGRRALAVAAVACATCLAVAAPADAAQKTTLYRFTGSPDGSYPGGLLVGPAGILYGQTHLGGLFGHGTVFRLVPPGAGQTQWTETVLYNFRGQFGPGGQPLYDGDGPSSGIVMDKAGNLYGTTSAGGQFNGGTVFRLSPPATGQTAWTETVLYRYFHQNPLRSGATGQTYPFGHLYLDSSDVIYGLTGPTSDEEGAVYRLAPPTSGTGPWILSTLTAFNLHFKYSPNEGDDPTGGVTLGPDGSFYGATEGSYAPGAGTAWRLTPPAAGQAAWTRQNFFVFGLGTRANGLLPNSLPIVDRSLNLYGTMSAGGAFNGGVVYKLSPPAPGQTAWTQSVLYNFPEFAQLPNVYEPELLINSDGALYGTTYHYGTGECGDGGDCGTVYKVTSRDVGGRMTPWNFVNIVTFNSAADGVPDSLVSTLLPDGRFALFGVTANGLVNRSAGPGTVFEIIP